MSRSIHTTLQHIAEAKRWDFSNTDRQEELLQALEEETTIKRRVKKRIDKERSAVGEPVYSTDTDLIPIEVKDISEYIHFPASVDDIRNVMRFLPRGVFDGVNEIELSLGVEYQDEDSASADDTEDPYTGRIGLEIIPGVYAARCQAIYTSGECTIKVFAYVYAPDLPDREIWECYLRLNMLSSFVHEASHHYDSTERIARGRWRMDDHKKVEDYAEEMQRNWMRDFVLPYVERTYPDQVKLLMDWVEYYGGYKLPLSMISGDPRAPWNDDTVSGINLFFDISSNIVYLAREVYDGKEPTKTRIGFANGLHYGEHYEPALQIIERVLADNPDDLDALTLKADIYVHQEMYVEATKNVNYVLNMEPDHIDALYVNMQICNETQEWKNLLDTANYLLDHFTFDLYDITRILLRRAKAYLELGDYDAVNTDIEAIVNMEWNPDSIPKYTQRNIDELRAEAERRNQ